VSALFDVIVYDGAGVEVARKPDLSGREAGRWADANRPSPGGTYIVTAGKALEFRPYHLGQPCLRPRRPALRRPTRKARLSLAQRLLKAGDSANAAQLFEQILREDVSN